MSLRNTSTESASSTRLSVRQRAMRGKRTATPERWRLEAVTASVVSAAAGIR